MVCGKCGKAFDESVQATEGRCPFCKTVHTPEGDPIRELKGILSYVAQHFGEKTPVQPVLLCCKQNLWGWTENKESMLLFSE